MSDLDTEPARYLLGELPEAERDAFEERFLADDELHELCRATEDDLFDAYAQDELAADRRLRFEAVFLHDAAGAHRLAAARALLRAARDRPIAARGFWARLFTTPLVWMAGAAITAAAIVAVVVSDGGGGGPDPGTPIVTVALVAPTRGGAPPIIHRGDATEIRFEPDVDTAVGVRLLGPRGTVIHATLEPGRPPHVLVAAADLAPGAYVLIVTPRGGDPVELPFSIAAP